MSTVTFNLNKADFSLLDLALYPGIIAMLIRPKDDSNQSTCGKYIALTVAEPFFIFGAVVGVIETVFWTAILLLAKTVHVFIPKSFETPTLICSWFYERTVLALEITATSFTYSVYNFFNTEKKNDEIVKAITKSMYSGLQKHDSCLNYQLFNCC